MHVQASVSVPLIGECFGACHVEMCSRYSRWRPNGGRELLFAGLGRESRARDAVGWATEISVRALTAFS